jgi:hypothetical protein
MARRAQQNVDGLARGVHCPVKLIPLRAHSVVCTEIP